MGNVNVICFKMFTCIVPGDGDDLDHAILSLPSPQPQPFGNTVLDYTHDVIVTTKNI